MPKHVPFWNSQVSNISWIPNQIRIETCHDLHTEENLFTLFHLQLLYSFLMFFSLSHYLKYGLQTSWRSKDSVIYTRNERKFLFSQHRIWLLVKTYIVLFVHVELQILFNYSLIVSRFPCKSLEGLNPLSKSFLYEFKIHYTTR